MSPNVNFTVDDIPKSFPPLPEDEVFTFEIVAQDVRQGPKGPYANLRLDVKDHPEYTGRVVFEILPLPDVILFKAMKEHPVESQRKAIAEAIGQRCFRTRQALLAIGDGAQFNFVETETPNRWDASPLMNKRFQAKCKTEEYQGEHRSRIGTYLPRVN